MFSIVATETSLLTFLSLPSKGYQNLNDLFFVQLLIGYIIGKILSSYILLPSYYNSNIISIYELIGQKFGDFVQRISSIIFLCTRLLADGVRFLLTAYVIAELINLPFTYCVIIVGVATIIYSTLGGVKAIINMDTIQFFIYVFGGLFSIAYILYASQNQYGPITINFSEFFNRDVFNFSINGSNIFFGKNDTYFFNYLVGGIFLSFCSHGVDYMMVQRALCTKDLKSAQKAMIGSGFIVLVQGLIFLFLGYLLLNFYQNGPKSLEADKEFIHFILNDLPIGIKGILAAGVLSAAMSTLSSSINSLTSSTIIDIKFKFSNNSKIYIGVFWCILLMAVALFFPYNKKDPLIITGLKIATFSYGLLLALFILTKVRKNFSTLSVLVGMFCGLIAVLFSFYYEVVWTWFILIGFLINIGVVFLINFIEKMTKKTIYISIIIIVQIFFISLFFNSALPKPINYGIDIFIKDNLNLVKDKKIAVLANKSSVDKNGNNIIDTLIKKSDIQLIKIFSPEHGFEANLSAGEHVDNSKYDNIDIISLYGSNKKPSVNDLNDIDVLIIDIQDIGSTYYTYMSTVTYMLEAAAKNNISVIVLDRPNPISRKVYGPIKENFNFIGMHPIPVRHGMTIGELCNMINEEGWLANGIKVKDLRIIEMDDLPDKDEYYDWIPPSPNIPNMKTAFIYNGTCLFEGTNISEGRGTDNPFRYIGAPWIDSNNLMNYINDLKKNRYGDKIDIKEIQFIPKSNEGAKSPKYENQTCYGISIDMADSVEPIEFSIYLLDYFNDNYEEFSFNENFFDILYGSSDLRECIISDCDIQSILNEIDKDVAWFNKIREKYLLY